MTDKERIDELERQFSLLTAMVSPKNAAKEPTEYYMSRYSGEEIDNGVSRALPGGAIDTDISASNAAIQQHPNPNLLDNWYFVGGGGPGQFPVNQRGKTEYTGAGNVISRWQIDDSCVLTLSQAGLKLSKKDGSGYGLLTQKLDCKQSDLVGMVVTGSVLSNNELAIFTIIVPSGDFDLPSMQIGGSKYVFNLFARKGNISFRIYPKSAAQVGDYVFINSVKLELGSIQTLAHKEGDKFVLNEIPDYGKQLQRCQRYLVKVDATARFAGSFSAQSTIVQAFIPTPVTMRTTPVVQGITSLSARFSSGMANSASLSVSDVILTEIGVLVLFKVSWSEGATIPPYSNTTVIFGQVGFLSAE